MIHIDDVRKRKLSDDLRGHFLREFDESLSEFRADEIVDFFLGALGPHVYNQAVQDARKYLQDKLDDLDGEVHVPEVL